MRDVARYYVRHLHATAGTPELVRRALERALDELERGAIETFVARMSRLRRSLRFDRHHPELTAHILRIFTLASHEARQGRMDEARSRLQPLLQACLEAAPRVGLA